MSIIKLFKTAKLQLEKPGFLLLELMIALVLFLSLASIIGAYCNSIASKMAQARQSMALVNEAINSIANASKQFFIHDANLNIKLLQYPSLPVEKQLVFSQHFLEKFKLVEVSLKNQNYNVSLIGCYEE